MRTDPLSLSVVAIVKPITIWCVANNSVLECHLIYLIRRVLLVIRRSVALIRWPVPANSPELQTFSDNAAVKITHTKKKSLWASQEVDPFAKHLQGLGIFPVYPASQCTKFPNRQPYLIQPMIIKQHTRPHAQHLPFPSELSNLSSAWADFQRLQRMGINATRVYSEKHRANSKRGRGSGRLWRSGESVHSALCCYRHRAYGSTLWPRWMWKPEPPAARADWNGSQCFNMFLLRTFTHSGVTAWFQVVKCLSIRVWKPPKKAFPGPAGSVGITGSRGISSVRWSSD